MSLRKRLDETIPKSRPGQACRLGSIIHGKEMPEEEKKYLNELLEAPLNDPNRVPSTAITKALQLEGYQIAMASVLKHRRKECRCYGFSPKFIEE